MRTFSRTSQFKKDVRRAEKQGKDMAKLKAALELLIDGKLLPLELKDHHSFRFFRVGAGHRRSRFQLLFLGSVLCAFCALLWPMDCISDRPKYL